MTENFGIVLPRAENHETIATTGVGPVGDVGANCNHGRESHPGATRLLRETHSPVLVTHCYACHATESPQIKGGLLLDTRAGVRRGGESGEIVVLGDPAASLLIKALKYADDAPAMPPRKQLPPEVIADFEKWVKLGAPDPVKERPPRSSTRSISKRDVGIGRLFAPRDVPPPEVKDAAWPRGTIDRHLLVALEHDGLKPVEDADPATLVRRVYLDLVGLPPSPKRCRRGCKS